MRDPVKLLVLGTGQMGAGIVRLVGRKRGLALVGVHGRRTERAGLDVGTAIGLDAPLGLPIRSDLERLCDEVQPDVAIQTTCSRASDAEPELAALLERGVNAITIAEEMAWPAAQSPELAARLRERWSQLQVLFMTGHARRELAERGLSIDEADCLQKPFLPDDLLEAVAALLRARAR